jgi:hypothetical protein
MQIEAVHLSLFLLAEVLKPSETETAACSGKWGLDLENKHLDSNNNSPKPSQHTVSQIQTPAPRIASQNCDTWSHVLDLKQKDLDTSWVDLDTNSSIMVTNYNKDVDQLNTEIEKFNAECATPPAAHVVVPSRTTIDLVSCKYFGAQDAMNIKQMDYTLYLKCDNYPKTGDNAYVSGYADVINARNNAMLPKP